MNIFEVFIGGHKGVGRKMGILSKRVPIAITTKVAIVGDASQALTAVLRKHPEVFPETIGAKFIGTVAGVVRA
jgi:hypothetical protein